MSNNKVMKEQNAKVSVTPGELAALRLRVDELERRVQTRVVFNGDDQFFLTWVLGFTAGANMERDGERGERIFARCRALHEKIAPVSMTPPPGVTEPSGGPS